MLDGKQVILDVIDPDDIEWLRKQRNNPELRQYFRAWKEISKDQQNLWYKERGNNTNINHVYFKIVEKKMCENSTKILDKKIIGCCGLHYIDWRMRSAEFSIFLDIDSRGLGFGKESLTMLFGYGFGEMNLHKIWCEVFCNNKSVNLYRKLGFHDDGVLRDRYFCNGKYGNSIMMSMLEDEWFDVNGGR